MISVKPNCNIAKSDEGFSVEIDGGGNILYKEGIKKIRIGTDYSFSPAAWMASKTSVKRWEPPFGIFPIDQKHREKIISRILQSAELMKRRIVFE